MAIAESDVVEVKIAIAKEMGRCELNCVHATSEIRITNRVDQSGPRLPGVQNSNECFSPLNHHLSSLCIGHIPCMPFRDAHSARHKGICSSPLGSYELAYCGTRFLSLTTVS